MKKISDDVTIGRYPEKDQCFIFIARNDNYQFMLKSTILFYFGGGKHEANAI